MKQNIPLKSSNHSFARTARSGTGALISANPAALQFCWHLRVGLLRNIEPGRIKAYADFFYRTYLDQHLFAQESLVRNCGGISVELMKKTQASHKRLRMLFENADELYHTLRKIEGTLDQHVRLEQTVLFTEIYIIFVQTGRDSSKLAGQFYNQTLARKLHAWEDRYWALD